MRATRSRCREDIMPCRTALTRERLEKASRVGKTGAKLGNLQGVPRRWAFRRVNYGC